MVHSQGQNSSSNGETVHFLRKKDRTWPEAQIKIDYAAECSVISLAFLEEYGISEDLIFVNGQCKCQHTNARRVKLTVGHKMSISASTFDVIFCILETPECVAVMAAKEKFWVQFQAACARYLAGFIRLPKSKEQKINDRVVKERNDARAREQEAALNAKDNNRSQASNQNSGTTEQGTGSAGGTDSARDRAT